MSSFVYIPFHLVLQMPAVINKKVTQPIQCLAGSAFLKGYSTLEELEFNETQKDDDPNDPYYQWEIIGFMPGDSSTLIELMEDMEHVRHLVIVNDNLNQKRLVGYDAPLNFKSIFQSGNKPGQARGYKYTFSGLSPKRAPVYSLG